ncbi:hypothetical protein [Flindersiella endophytica]
MRRFFQWYGGNPLHLLVFVATMAVTAYAMLKLLPRNPIGVIVWFGVAIVAHDLVLLPIYSLANRSVSAVLRHRALRLRLPARTWLNHIRIPAALSGLLLLTFFPLIAGIPKNFAQISGGPLPPFLGRWLLVTAVLFAASAIALAVRVRLATPRR